MRHYVTLCDYAYLPRAIVLYESLKRYSSDDFRLIILAMDDGTAVYCRDKLLASSRLNIIKRSDIYALIPALTWQEYCWLCASQITEFLLMENMNRIDELVYLDADMMFFSDPKQIFDEIGDRSIGIIPHRFSNDTQHLAVNGQFNVSWVSFKNTAAGRECLSRWAAQVREKCSASDGCGDQKYLDEWPALYGDEVCIIQNPGAGLAPWNIAQYEITEGPNVDGQPVVFYHYHEFKQEETSFYLTGHRLRASDRDLIYDPYIDEYIKASNAIESLRLRSG